MTTTNTTKQQNKKKMKQTVKQRGSLQTTPHMQQQSHPSPKCLPYVSMPDMSCTQLLVLATTSKISRAHSSPTTDKPNTVTQARTKHAHNTQNTEAHSRLTVPVM
jgi:hypothetical protein